MKYHGLGLGLNTKEVSRITEAKVLARLVELGKHVLVPFANVGRYDLLVDNRDGTFMRIECKTGKLIKGCVRFHTSSRGGYGTGPARSYRDDADAFGVWCPETGDTYLIPIEQATENSMMIRVTEPNPRSNCTAVKWAKDFKL